MAIYPDRELHEFLVRESQRQHLGISTIVVSMLSAMMANRLSTAQGGIGRPASTGAGQRSAAVIPGRAVPTEQDWQGDVEKALGVKKS